MGRTHRPILILLGCMVVALTVIPPGGFQRLVPNANAAVLQNVCWPGNTANDHVYSTGATHAKGSVVQHPEEGLEAETDVFGTETDLVANSVSVEFEADITAGGTVTGWLEIVIKGLNGTPTIFQSGCVAEIQTESNSSGSFEGEFEGSVQDFPGYTGTTKAAVASLTVNDDPNNVGKKRVSVSIELGTTCREGGYPGQDPNAEIELAVTMVKVNPNKFVINNVTAGRANFPPGFNDGNCPGFDVEGDTGGD